MEEKDQNDNNDMQDYFDLKSEPVQPEFTEKQETHRSKDFFILRLIGSSILLPLNYIQANQVTKGISKPSLSSIISQGMSPNGISSLYRGLDSFLLSKSISYISNFLLLAFFKDSQTKSTEKKTVFDLLYLSISINTITGFITSPFDCILIRSQTLSASANKNYANLYQTIKYLSENKELAGLFKGAAANIFFKGFGNISFLIWSLVYYFPKKESSGLISAVVATCATMGLVYPIEFLRIRMQSDISNLKSINYVEIYKETIRRQGISGLYAGFGIYCLNKLLFSILFYSVSN